MKKQTLTALLALLPACSFESMEPDMCSWGDTGVSYTAMPNECAKVCSVEPSSYAVIYSEYDPCEVKPWDCVLLYGGQTAAVVEDWTDKFNGSDQKYTVEIVPCEELDNWT